MANETKKTTEKTKKDGAKVSSKLQKIIDEVAELSVLELSDLVKALEDKFGVQAMAAVPAAAPAAGQAAAAAPAEEKTAFTVIMTDSGSAKINVIKALREIKMELNLTDAKALTDKVPAEILTNVKKEQADEAKAKLEAAGAKVELK